MSHERATQKRRTLIIQALADLGGEATTGAIAVRLDFDVNGVSQTLGRMERDELIKNLGGKDRNRTWKLLAQTSQPAVQPAEATSESLTE